MKLIDTIELLTEILVGKKEETRSQKKIRTTDVKTKGKTAKKNKWKASSINAVLRSLVFKLLVFLVPFIKVETYQIPLFLYKEAMTFP